MDYDNINDKTVITVKCSKKLSERFGLGCKVVGNTDKSEVIRRFMMNFVYEIQSNPIMKDVPIQILERHITKKTMKGMPDWRINDFIE